MLSFTAWSFALAGALCALGPIIIHLLNRRRYRVVPWGAMEFLRVALKQKRRKLQIRDLILLVIRTAAVLLFGLALARPFWRRDAAAFDPRQPSHAILVIDNSLSMAYESLDGTLIARAKDAAREMVGNLPVGSRYSIVPACGGASSLTRDPYDNKDAALEAIERITVVDRALSLASVEAQIQQAASAAPGLASHPVLITDQQARNWRGIANSPGEDELAAVQVLTIAANDWENSCVANIRLEDGLADVETPTVVVVEIAHRGRTARRDLQVTLSLGDTILGQKTVSLEAGDVSREVEFECHFAGLTELPEASRPVYAALRATLTPDRLPADDQRTLIVPVVASLPVVFIDQHGASGEDPGVGRLGETRNLRRLLAPRTSRSDAPRQLVSVRHFAPHEVTREVLADARLVVVAGVSDPSSLVSLLYEYVTQGGPLVIAAGGPFDPQLWNQSAWDGAYRLLPWPLKEAPIGQTPDESRDELKPFFLSLESTASEPYFALAGLSDPERAALFAEPLFFKAVEPDESAAALRSEGKGTASSDPSPTTPWLSWASGDTLQKGDESPAVDPAANAAIARPRVLARYDLPQKPAFLVQRKVGRGQVLFCSTGLLSAWNTLPKTNAFLIFDRILRGMIEDTLPAHNFPSSDELTLAVPPGETGTSVTLSRPGGESPEPLDVSFISARQRGVALHGLLERGVYRVQASRATGDAAPSSKAVWEISLAVNGEAAESDLTPLSQSAQEQLASAHGIAFLGSSADIELSALSTAGRRSWRWLLLVVLGLLLAEMLTVVVFHWLERSHAGGVEPPAATQFNPAGMAGISPFSRT